MSDTTFPLKMTFEQKASLLVLAREAGYDVDKPGALNAFILKRVGVAS